MKIGVIDYGASNIFSVVRALNSLGAKTSVVKKPEDFNGIDKLVFPGQGSMGSCMSRLNEAEMTIPMKEFIEEKPFLGICLGLQVLFSGSQESTEEKGLGVFSEEIKKFNSPKDTKLKIPHMGWNQIDFSQDHFLWNGLESGEDYYFVHSYISCELKEEFIYSKTEHGQTFNSAISKDNIFATQFHPEKSGKLGLKFLENFLNWRP